MGSHTKALITFGLYTPFYQIRFALDHIRVCRSIRPKVDPPHMILS